MKNKFLITLIFNISLLFGQKQFKEATIILNNDSKLLGYVNDENIFSGKIVFKKILDSVAYELPKENIKTIILEGKTKYIYEDVEIDENRKNLDLKDSYSQVDVKKKKIKTFLKYIVEGDKSLLISEINNIIYYFIIRDNKFEYLVYNEYRNVNSVKRNESYKSQLLSYLKCESVELNLSIRNLKYHKDDLLKIFQSYYVCSKSDQVKFYSDDKGELGYSMFAGAKYYMAKFNSGSYLLTSVSDNHVSPVIGLEMNYDMSKFELVSRISLSNIRINALELTQSAYDINGIAYNYVNFDSKIIDFNLGFRKKFNLHKRIIYTDFLFEYSLLFDSTTKSAVVVDDSSEPELFINHKSKDAVSLNFGFGYEINKKISVEIRYILGKDHHNNKTSIGSNVSNFGLNVVYSFK